jgi:hypothetical protein
MESKSTSETAVYFYETTRQSNGPVWKAENAAVGLDVLTTCQPSTVRCSRERLPAAAAQPAKVRQSCSATDLFILYRVKGTKSRCIRENKK